MYRKHLNRMGGLFFVLAVPYFLLMPNFDDIGWFWILGTMSLLGISAMSFGYSFYDREKNDRTFFRAVILSLLLFVGYLVLFVFILYFVFYFNMRHL